MPNPEYPPITWDSDNPGAQLGQLFDYSVKNAESAINWYAEKSFKKRVGAWLFRFGPVVLTTLAGLVPLLDDPAFVSLDARWATVGVALAGLLVALDRFGRFSSGWIRFITAELELRQKLDEFRFDWEAIRASWPSADPTSEHVQSALGLLRTFVTQVHTVIRNETKLWSDEFEKVVDDLKKSTESVSTERKAGALNLEITNADDFSEGWSLSVDSGPASRQFGKHVSVTGLQPGIHKFHVQGTRGGKKCTLEHSVSIAAGQIASHAVNL